MTAVVAAKATCNVLHGDTAAVVHIALREAPKKYIPPQGISGAECLVARRYLNSP